MFTSSSWEEQWLRKHGNETLPIWGMWVILVHCVQHVSPLPLQFCDAALIRIIRFRQIWLWRNHENKKTFKHHSILLPPYWNMM